MIPPIDTIQCARCTTFCVVCAAGFLDSRFYLRSNFIRRNFKGNATFSEITQTSVRYTDSGAKDREQYWLQKARKYATTHIDHRY